MWTKVSSSNIEALAHEGDRLLVQFKSGAIYAYENVTAELFRAVKTAASVGRTFNELIKSRPSDYPFFRLE